MSTITIDERAAALRKTIEESEAGTQLLAWFTSTGDIKFDALIAPTWEQSWPQSWEQTWVDFEDR